MSSKIDLHCVWFKREIEEREEVREKLMRKMVD